MSTSLNSHEPITVIVSRQVKPGHEEDFETWVKGVVSVAVTYPGHKGAELIKPTKDNPAYTLIFRFDSPDSLARWDNSSDKKEWLAKVKAFEAAEPVVQKVTGLEYWFQLPDTAATKPPPRHKMAFVTVIALWPLINIVNPLLNPMLRDWPPLMASFITVSIMITLMTYLVMPLMVRIFRGWLFPGG